MEAVRVVDVTDGNTIAINPPWRCGAIQGYLVRIKGLVTEPLSVPRGQIARCKMTLMLLGSWVEIVPTGSIEGNAMVCDVIYQGRALPAHFPEYAEVCKGPAGGRETPVDAVEQHPPASLQRATIR